MFSALKRDGIRLYRLARQGKSVPRPMREVKIGALRLCSLSRQELEIELVCSKGTYVRSLAADMGCFLGCGGHLKASGASPVVPLVWTMPCLRSSYGAWRRRENSL